MQGVTRLFLTKIPFFREVIVSSFACESCGMQNAELQPAGRIQDKGCIYTVSIQTPQVQLQSMGQVCQASQVQSMAQVSQSSQVQSMAQVSQVQSMAQVSQSSQVQSIAQVCQSSQVQSMAQVSQSSQVQSMTQISQSSQVQSMTQISQSSQVQSMAQVSQSSQVQSMTQISQSHQNQSIEVSQTSQVQSIETDQLSQGDVVFFNVGVFVGVSALFWLWTERQFSVRIWVMTVHLTNLRSDVLLCFTPFYLIEYFYLCYVELSVVFCLEFKWPKSQILILCIYFE